MLTIDTTTFVLIDVQGNLAQAMYEKEALLQNLKTLIQGLRILDVHFIVTEQYPKGLGPTLPEIAELLPPNLEPIGKMHFSCCGDDIFMSELHREQRNKVVVAGIESHVCVYQTVRDLLHHRYEVEVVADAVSSRTAFNKEIGLTKMRDRGARLTSVEMVLFELMGIAGGEKFKAIQKLIK